MTQTDNKASGDAGLLSNISDTSGALVFAYRNGFRAYAIAVTPWHLLGIRAALLSFGVAPSECLLIVQSHTTSGFLIDAAGPRREGFQVVRIDSVGGKGDGPARKIGELLSIRAHRREEPLVCLKPLEPSLFISLAGVCSGGVIRYVQTDEGVGSYLMDPSDWDDLRAREGGGSGGSCGKDVLGRLFGSRLEKWRSACSTFMLFDSAGAVNEDARSWYLEALQGDTHPDAPGFEDKTVVICTGIFAEIGSIGPDAYYSAIASLCEALTSSGYSVLVKPHPRERDIARYSGMSCVVDERKGTPLETLLSGSGPGPAGVVGIDTTALVTASVLYGAMAIDISGFFDDGECSESFIKHSERFRSFFSGVVATCSSPSEVIEVLRSAPTAMAREIADAASGSTMGDCHDR